MAARACPPVARAWALAAIASLGVTIPSDAGQEAVFRGVVEAVRVDASVTRGGTPVPGLTAAHFEILDNGVSQKVDRVSREEVPLALMLVLDTSGSVVGDRLQALVDAAQGLVGSLRPDDQVGLLTFSQDVRLSVPLTTRHEVIRSALGRLEASGPTALRDALFVGLQSLTPDTDARPVALVFTDGRDTASWITASDLEPIVRRSGIVLHAVGLTTTIWSGQDSFGRNVSRVLGPSQSLQEAVRAGGGRHWSATEPKQLKQLFASALNELRARYLLTYYPLGVARPGWHDVKVRLKGTRGDVVARPGYFVAQTP